jgi:hypothetical protein
MKPTSKETADNPSTPARHLDLIDPYEESRGDLPIDDRPGSERDLNPHELVSCEEDTRELLDEEDYDSSQAYQIALNSAKDIEKTLKTPKPLNFDGDSYPNQYEG